MATPSVPASAFDPEDHVLSPTTDSATIVPAGVTTLTDWFVAKSRPETDQPITCWHCYTNGTVTWCVEVDCPFPQPPKVKTQQP